ncbi:MAG: Crp/Fnr family transcriptional regulator [Porphyromonas sp.]|nr:Crp/Fnr family transcriptional regulator [Porphyromonas sp.]
MKNEKIKCPRLFNYFCSVECAGKFPDKLIEMLAEKPRKLREFAKGEHIAYQGDSIEMLMLLAKGSVRMEIISDTGYDLFVAEHKAPFPLGASLLFSSNHRFSHDVIALEDCVVEYYDLEGVEKALTICPHFRRGFLNYSSNQLQDLSQRLQIFSIKKIRSKLAYYILEQANSEGEFSLGMSVTSLAEYFGVTRSALSRVITELVELGAIEYDKGDGKVLDKRKLANEI